MRRRLTCHHNRAIVPKIPFITEWLIDGVDHWQQLRASLVDDLAWGTLAKRTDPREG